MIRRILFTTCLSFVCSIGAAEVPEWPQFRGPNGSGIAADAKPPVSFGPEKNVKWKVPVASGASSPVVVGDKL
ncbi:MAG TPA: pyrrolo-quinoline quinone, partial [Schlesneria sp.]